MAAPALAPVGNFDPSVPAHRAIPLPRVRRMAADGYRLALLEDATGTGRTVAGARVLEILHTGQMLDVDDFVPDSARRSLAPATASSTGSSPRRDP